MEGNKLTIKRADKDFDEEVDLILKLDPPPDYIILAMPNRNLTLGKVLRANLQGRVDTKIMLQIPEEALSNYDTVLEHVEVAEREGFGLMWPNDSRVRIYFERFKREGVTHNYPWKLDEPDEYY